ncbi:MAG: argininosuccinate lyase, partial [Tissierellia bacterium]|nr:argininosuccinate lyase [Tissierellia bacterium]
MANLWSGRFEKVMDEIVEEFNASIFFDKRLYDCDIAGSIAHVTMLCQQGIVNEEEKENIIRELQIIKKQIEENEIVFNVHNEDIHMAIEGILIERLGDTGKKLHTARSRNDQVAVDTRLYVKNEINEMIENIKYLEYILLEKAEKYYDKLMVGFTHMQHAQPVTVGFHLMAYFQMFKRDMERFYDCHERTDYNPLGSCALAGTTIPIDRHLTTKLLGFKNVTENAMDSVSD